jgi:3-hydroxyisobutyrate dehydrogenase-like beta-hydroxyacid dehydrogenase
MDVRISMIGLGRMGSALARGFLRCGATVTVWNRDPAKAEALRGEGAIVARSLAEALQASDLIAVSVLDTAASHALLFSPESAPLLRGKAILDFTTSTPAVAREAMQHATETGAQYLDGALMCYPSGVGTPDATILFSGAKTVFDRYEPQLKALGNAMFLGDKVGAAATLDLALLDFYYGATAAMLHGVAMCESENFPLEIYAKALAGFAPIVAQTAELATTMVPARRYAGSEATNDIHAAALALIVRAAKDAKLDPFPERIMGYFKSALAKGHGPDEIVALVETMRP